MIDYLIYRIHQDGSEFLVCRFEDVNEAVNKHKELSANKPTAVVEYRIEVFYPRE